MKLRPDIAEEVMRVKKWMIKEGISHIERIAWAETKDGKEFEEDELIIIEGDDSIYVNK